MRHKVVLYNPQAAFYTMPLALLAVGSHLDPRKYDVRIIDGRLETEQTVVAPRPVVIFEGVYTARPELSELVDLRILLQVSEKTRVARLLAREGAIGAWERQWHEAEEWYFARVLQTDYFDAVSREPRDDD